MAVYEADEFHSTPGAGSTPTAAELSMLQAQAFQAVLDQQEARKNVQPSTSFTAGPAEHFHHHQPIGAAAVMASATAATSVAAAATAEHPERAQRQMGSAHEEPSHVSVRATGQQSLLVAESSSSQLLVPSASSQNGPSHGVSATSDLDVGDIQLETDGAAHSYAALLPHAEASEVGATLASEAALPASTADACNAAGTSGRTADAPDEAMHLLSGLQTYTPQDMGEASALHPGMDSRSQQTHTQSGSSAPALTSFEDAGLDPAWTAGQHHNHHLADPSEPSHSAELLHESALRSWCQDPSLAASTAASESSHDTLHDTPAGYSSAVPMSAACAAVGNHPAERFASVSSLASSLHPLGHFHASPSRQSDLSVDTAGPSPIEPPWDPSIDPPAAQDQDPVSVAAKSSIPVAESQPTMSRVMSKLHSLQSMTHRYHCMSHFISQHLPCIIVYEGTDHR